MTKCVQALAPSVYGGLAARVVAGWFQSALVAEGHMSVRHMNFVCAATGVSGGWVVPLCRHLTGRWIEKWRFAELPKEHFFVIHALNSQVFQAVGCRES